MLDVRRVFCDDESFGPVFSLKLNPVLSTFGHDQSMDHSKPECGFSSQSISQNVGRFYASGGYQKDDCKNLLVNITT